MSWLGNASGGTLTGMAGNAIQSGNQQPQVGNNSYGSAASTISTVANQLMKPADKSPAGINSPLDNSMAQYGQPKQQSGQNPDYISELLNNNRKKTGWGY